MRYFVVLAILTLPVYSYAASLTITPQSQNTTVGEQVTVSLVADTSGQLVTSVEGELRYNPAVLEPLMVSTAGSAFSMWATEPDLSTPGVVPFSGWASAPQSGAELPVAQVSFRVTGAGVHDLSLASGALLAYDGKGSNIISSLGRAEISAALTTEGRVLGASTTDVPPPPPTVTVHAAIDGDMLVVVGESEPGSRVVLTLDGPQGIKTLKADAPHGTYTIVGDRLAQGSYTLSGEAYSASGLLSSARTETFSIAMRPEKQLAAALFASPSYATILVAILSFLFGFLVYYVFSIVRRR